MPRWALDIEYIGAEYAGSQTQDSRVCETHHNNPNVKTIQGELEQALSTLIKTNAKTIFSGTGGRTKTIFSGRTDAGVNALGQVAHFDTDSEIEPDKMLNSLNALLPKDISVKGLRRVDDKFHAQKSAKWRWYRYVIANRKQRSVWDRPSLLVRNELNVERLNESLSYLKGKHDFTTFKCSRTNNPAKECRVYIAKASKLNDMIYIDLVADRFLYNMVRIIVGTLLMIEENSLSPSVMKQILESKDRNKAGKTISPDGLYLMKVNYTKGGTFDESELYKITAMEAINENLFC